ncbi:MAG: NfeD family protein [Alphaproteobacteria bacterium]|nr:NfeD family protein [Alphaproteobacteria bacterium]
MEITYWYWISFGLFMIFSELVTPGFYFLWIGLAAVFSGLLLYFFPTLDFVIIGTFFAVSALVFCYLGKVSLYKRISDDSSSTLNKRGAQYIGQTVVVFEAIKNGSGKVKVGDSVWLAKSETDVAEGKSVKIIDVDGIMFIVK